MFNDIFIPLVLTLSLLASSCTYQSPAYVHSFDSLNSSRDSLLSNMQSRIEYDTNIMSVSLDGFRVQISASIASRIAKERGYYIDTRWSNITFDDLILSMPKGESRIYLKKKTEDGLNDLELKFEGKKVVGISLETTKYTINKKEKEASEMLDSILEKYGFLKFDKSEENFILYSYKPNTWAYLYASARWESYPQIKISVFDRNQQAQEDVNQAANKLNW